MARTLKDVTDDIEAWIQESGRAFAGQYLDEGRAWVLKFFPPQYLAGFMRRPQLVVSATPGFTWGDGVYVVPLDHVYSGMIYGRVGVMGWLDQDDVRRVYDGSASRGLLLYQEWIQFKPGLFRLLTTTVHAQFANRRLRNAFRRRFKLDLVFFRPDEFNRAYVQPARDRWFVVTDWVVGPALPAGVAGVSSKIRECEMVALGAEEFVPGRTGFVRQDLIGPQVSPPGAVRVVAGRTPLAAPLMSTYSANRARGSGAPRFLLTTP